MADELSEVRQALSLWADGVTPMTLQHPRWPHCAKAFRFATTREAEEMCEEDTNPALEYAHEVYNALAPLPCGHCRGTGQEPRA